MLIICYYIISYVFLLYDHLLLGVFLPAVVQHMWQVTVSVATSPVPVTTDYFVTSWGFGFKHNEMTTKGDVSYMALCPVSSSYGTITLIVCNRQGFHAEVDVFACPTTPLELQLFAPTTHFFFVVSPNQQLKRRVHVFFYLYLVIKLCCCTFVGYVPLLRVTIAIWLQH